MNQPIDQVLSQMRAIEALAKSQQPQAQQQSEGTGSFADLMQRAINEVNQSQSHASEMRKALELGDPNVDIAQVMIAMQKSSVAFQALTEVRNKLLTAYQDIMNMPV